MFHSVNSSRQTATHTGDSIAEKAVATSELKKIVILIITPFRISKSIRPTTRRWSGSGNSHTEGWLTRSVRPRIMQVLLATTFQAQLTSGNHPSTRNSSSWVGDRHRRRHRRFRWPNRCSSRDLRRLWIVQTTVGCQELRQRPCRERFRRAHCSVPPVTWNTTMFCDRGWRTIGRRYSSWPV